MALLSRNQAQFAARLAQRTGLNPRLVGAWVIAEQPAGADKPVGHDDQNWLNIGLTDSKWIRGGDTWSDPIKAADNSAAWLQGKFAVPGFGRSADGIRAFSRTAGRPIGEQIAALQRSGWASSGYPDLPALVRQTNGKLGLRPYMQVERQGLPASQPAKLKVPGAPTLRLTERTAFDQAGYEAATRRFALGQILRQRPASPFDIGPSPAGGARPVNTLLSVLPTAPPDPFDFAQVAQSLEQVAGRPLRLGADPSSRRRRDGGLPRGRAVVVPGADRAGAPTNRRITDFVSLVAGSIGRPINITTGTNHSQMTTSGNVSDHWVGDGADIAVPVNSREGDMIAGRALLLAGVPRRRARQMAQSGGLYTLKPSSGPLKGMRVQIIWRTQEGGDHSNHVHIGIRPA